MCFFIAQLIYTFRCHRDIKDYPSEVSYVQAYESTSSDEELNKEYFHVYKNQFTQFGGAIRTESFKKSETFRRNHSREMLRRRLISDKPEDFLPSLEEDALIELSRVVSNVGMGVPFFSVYWQFIVPLGTDNILKNLGVKRSYRDFLSPEVTFVNVMLRNAENHLNNSHWRSDTLKRRYVELNTNNVISRRTAALFYGLGSLYFIFTSVVNVFRVLDSYGWFDSIKAFSHAFRSASF